MKSFARLYALPKRKTETTADSSAGGHKAATPPRKATPLPPSPPQGSEPPSPPDADVAKRDAVEAAWQRMQGDDAEATALAAKKLRSYARVRVCTPPFGVGRVIVMHGAISDDPDTSEAIAVPLAGRLTSCCPMASGCRCRLGGGASTAHMQHRWAVRGDTSCAQGAHTCGSLAVLLLLHLCVLGAR